MRTQFLNRRAAAMDYAIFRKTWSRQAAFWLTVVRHGSDWKWRLAAGLALLACGIPLDGYYKENRR